jgi:hypothetical protein
MSDLNFAKLIDSNGDGYPELHMLAWVSKDGKPRFLDGDELDELFAFLDGEKKKR